MLFNAIGSRVMGWISPYLGYIALVGVGAFGIVLYLYADEKEDHRSTQSDLATLTVDYEKLQQDFRKLEESQAASEAQQAALRKELANAQDLFKAASDKATEHYRTLREQQEALAALAEQRARIRAELEKTKAELSEATTYTPVSHVEPISLAPVFSLPPQEVSDEEIQDAVCNTTPFSDDVVDYVHERLRSIYENGISLSN